MNKTNFKIHKILSILACLIVFISTAHADLDKKISEYVSSLIPGDGITETSIELNNADTDNINFSILDFIIFFLTIQYIKNINYSQ